MPTITSMPPRKTPYEPLHTYELTPEHKHEFVNLIREGHRPDSAAEQIGSTATQFRRLRNPQGAHYDPEFTQAYHDALASNEHQANFLELIRDAVWNAAKNGNSRLLEKLSLVYDPHWEPLRHQNLQVDMNIRGLIMRLPTMTDEELVQAIETEMKRAAVTGQPVKLIEAGE